MLRDHKRNWLLCGACTINKEKDSLANMQGRTLDGFSGKTPDVFMQAHMQLHY